MSPAVRSSRRAVTARRASRSAQRSALRRKAVGMDFTTPVLGNTPPKKTFVSPITLLCILLSAFPAASLSQCTAGQVNSTGPFSNSFPCGDCPAGTYQDGATCTTCLAGKSSDKGSTICYVCEGGRFTESTGSAHLFLVSNGVSRENTSEANFTTRLCSGGCGDGFFINSLSAADHDESGDCSSCAAGKSSTAGDANCTICKAGKYRNGSTPGGNCEDCAEGRYLVDDATSVGMHDDESNCVKCAGGKYSDGAI